MNAQIATEQELLPPTGTAIAEYAPTAAGLAELRKQLAGVTFDCTTKAGDKQARESRRVLVCLRTELESRRKTLKAPLLDRGKLLDDEARRITAEIVALEQPIDVAIKAEEARAEQARIERQRIEAERVAAITADIDAIRNLPLVYVSATQPVLREAIEALESRNLAEVFDAQYLPLAESAYTAALAGLNRALDARVAADAEAERLAAGRAELERQRAEQAEAKRIADAEAAAARAEADRLAREQLEAQAAAAKAEQERVAAAQAVVQDRLDYERAELAQQQEAQRLLDVTKQRAADADAAQRELQEWRDARTVDFVFQGNEHDPDLLFVEVERLDGTSIGIGEWSQRGDYRCLRVVLAEPVA